MSVYFSYKFLENCPIYRLRDGLKCVLRMSRYGNQYLQLKQPWAKSKEIDADRWVSSNNIYFYFSLCCSYNEESMQRQVLLLRWILSTYCHWYLNHSCRRRAIQSGNSSILKNLYMHWIMLFIAICHLVIRLVKLGHCSNASKRRQSMNYVCVFPVNKRNNIFCYFIVVIIYVVNSMKNKNY